MKRKETLGKYVWMCQTPGRVSEDDAKKLDEHEQNTKVAETVAGKGCGHFEWAEFDDDGAPLYQDQKERDEPNKKEQLTL